MNINGKVALVAGAGQGIRKMFPRVCQPKQISRLLGLLALGGNVQGKFDAVV